MRSHRRASVAFIGANTSVQPEPDGTHAVGNTVTADIFSRTLLELSPDAVVSIDHAGRVVEFNPAAERIFGYDRSAVLGRPMAELIIPPKHRAAHYTGLKRYLATGEARILGRALELEAMHANGMTVPVQVSIVRVPLSDPPVFISFLRDLTPQRRAAARQQILADAGAILGASLDHEETLTNLSRVLIPALADWYAVDIREPRSGEVRRIHVDHRDPSKLAMAHLMARKYPSTSEDQGVRAVLRTGKTEWLREIPDDVIDRAAQNPEHRGMLRSLGLRSYIIVPLSVRGTVYGAMTLVTAETGRLYEEEDVALAEELGKRAGQAVENARLFRELDHHRGQLEAQQSELEAQTAELEETAQALGDANAKLERSVEALEARTREADEANKAKADFLAAMSHELRTPLNAVLGYVELLTMGLKGPVTAEQSEALERVRRSGQHLLGLINDVLNFAKLEAGHIDYHITPVPVAEVLVAAAEILVPQVAAKDIRYRERNKCPGAVVFADQEKLVQILINLLGNAVRHTPAGGEITISCERDGPAIRIRVSDTGSGIPANKLDAIFEPFVQIQGLHDTQRQGTGLGLSISRDLARAMHGDVTVESELGGGATFTVLLPAGD